MKAYDMSEHWRLVSLDKDPDADVKISGTFWVKKSRRGEVQVEAIDVLLWYGRSGYGRVIREMHAFITGDQVRLPHHMIDERVRDDVIAHEELVKEACLAVARAPWRPLAEEPPAVTE